MLLIGKLYTMVIAGFSTVFLVNIAINSVVPVLVGGLQFRDPLHQGAQPIVIGFDVAFLSFVLRRRFCLALLQDLHRHRQES